MSEIFKKKCDIASLKVERDRLNELMQKAEETAE